MKLLRLSEVRNRIPFSRAQIYRMIAAGKFPAPVKFEGHNASFWREQDVEAFIEKCVAVQIRPQASQLTAVAQ